MRNLFVSTLLLLSLPLLAQSEGRHGTATTFSLDGTVGMNYALSRKPRPDRISSQGVALQTGLRAGLAGNLHLSYSRTSLILGFDLIQDRVIVNNYTKQSNSNLLFEPEPLRIRTGELAVNETQLRGHLGVRIDWEKVALISSFSVSGMVSGGQTFDFVQTTRGFADPFTGNTIFLDEPLVASGSVDYPTQALRENTYGALLLAGGYRLSPRFTLWLELELGLQVGRSISSDREYRQFNSRIGLMAGYRLVGQ